mmetsp:Transcript_1831/g.6502  ORF Transcript_1831/g.6502 Transcript_1831/m.6502 type:complete len:594 (-) Transcript_1831:90-1871(-)
MKRIESEAYLASIHTSSSFKKRIIHDYTPPSEPEPLHDATLVEDRIAALKMQAHSAKKKKNKFQIESHERKMSGDSAEIVQKKKEVEELLVYRKGKKVLEDVQGNLKNVLGFSSAFESGNLQSVTKIGENEYNLTLSPDIGTTTWVQWFYFEVEGMKKGVTYKFNINNFYKVDSLFNYGLKPLIYIEGKGWRRAGENIAYFPNEMYNENTESSFFTTTWTYTPTEDIETAYWAHCYPYTYSDLQDYLTELEALNLPFFERDTLCYTLAHNRIDLLTITAPTDNELDMKSRQGVILSARVHPGETTASWTMKGAIDFLVSDDPEAVYLREHYVFKIVPMLNPDGVIVGNYRCSLSGQDLNRTWIEADALTFPEIHAYKKFIEDFSDERSIILFTDFHSHSKKFSSFMFGNTSKNRFLRLSTRVFPLLLSKHSENLVNYNYCTFSISKMKASTARVVAYKDLKIMNSFTLEASLCGPSTGDVHFLTLDYEKMGMYVCKALVKYEDKPYVQKLVLQLSQMYHQREKKRPLKKTKPVSDAILSEAKRAAIKARKGAAKQKMDPSQKLMLKKGSQFVLAMTVLPVVGMFVLGVLGYGF